MDKNGEIKFVKAVTGFGVVVSIIALVLAVSAYNRSGTNLGQEIVETVDQIEISTESTLTLATAQAELAAVRAEFLAERNYELARQQVQNVRQSLSENVDQTEENTAELMAQINTSLMSLEEDLRSESADAVDSFQQTLELMEKNIRD